MPWVKAAEARLYYSITAPTLRKWYKNKQLNAIKLPSGRYKYWIESKKEASNNQADTRQTIIYARVSSAKQSSDLRRQEEYLKQKYPNAILKSDIGSGLNYRRTHFKTILQCLFKRNIKEVVVAHKDRFTRIAFEFFKWVFNEFGAVLKSLEDEKYAEGTGDEFTDDLMSIITVFTARYYGSRKYKETKNNEKRTFYRRKASIEKNSNNQSKKIQT